MALTGGSLQRGGALRRSAEQSAPKQQDRAEERAGTGALRPRRRRFCFPTDPPSSEEEQCGGPGRVSLLLYITTTNLDYRSLESDQNREVAPSAISHAILSIHVLPQPVHPS